MKKLLWSASVAAVLGVCGPAFASTITVFSDDFEAGNLAQWSPNHYGQIVANPAPNAVDSSAHALNFSHTYAGGDIFTSAPITLTSGWLYTVSFDYLGYIDPSNSGSSGGFAGLQDAASPGQVWYAASMPYSTVTVHLADGAGWNSYSYSFVPPISIGTAHSPTSFKLMFEDFNGAGPTAGNAYFDNILVTVETPLPAALPLFVSSLGGLGMLGWRRKRKTPAVLAT